ncbi:hypothetical protein BDN67DRAFT_967726 [Paxillus ammoniavirescens]|nr:hypothetical protein BDN67DRAFT_967726 [Paxillus ammoniavirescens]
MFGAPNKTAQQNPQAQHTFDSERGSPNSKRCRGGGQGNPCITLRMSIRGIVRGDADIWIFLCTTLRAISSAHSLQ